MSNKLNIVTNNVPREIIYGFELPASKRKDFDYIESDEDFNNNQFVKYLGHYYDVGEFMRIEKNSDLKDWDGYSSDSYFSGILIKFCEDNDYVIMGRYYS